MTGLDYIVVVAILVGGALGFMRGFVQEVLALAAWLAVAIALRFLFGPVSWLIKLMIGSDIGAGIIAFVLLIALPWYGTRWFARSVGRASRQSGLGPVDRLLGLGFGALKLFVVIALAFALIAFACDLTFGRPQWMTRASAYPLLNATSEEIISVLGKRRANADTTASAPALPGDEVPPEGRPRHHKRKSSD